MEHKNKQNKKTIAIFSWILVFLWMGFIFYMSAQDSVASSGFSRPLTETAAKYLARFHLIDQSNLTNAAYITELESTVRKIAHSTVFFILSVFVSIALLASGTKGVRVLVISIALSLFYAFADEFHQFFVPGRATEMADIFLDMLGIVLGTILVLAFAALFGKKHKAKAPAPVTVTVSVPEQEPAPFIIPKSEKVLEFRPKTTAETRQQPAQTQPAHVQKEKAVSAQKDVSVAMWFKVGFAVSFGVLCAITSSDVRFMPISALFAFFAVLIVILKTDLLGKNIKKLSVPRMILAAALSVFTIIRVYASFRLVANAYIADLGIVIDDLYYNFIRSGLSAFAVPSIIVIWYILLDKAKILAAKIRFTKFEVIYIASFTFVVSLALLYIYHRTSVFHDPADVKNVIFSLDSSVFINEFSYTNFTSAANNIFRPLFSLGAMPFGVLSRIISYPLSVLPGYDMAAAEALALSAVNAALLCVTAVLFARVFNIKNNILFISLFTMTFPALFCLVMASGNIVTAFYVALFLFTVTLTGFSYTPALVAMSSVFLPFAAMPLAIGKRRNRLKNSFKAYAYLAVLILVCSNITAFRDILGTIKHIPRLREVVPSVLSMSFMSIFAPAGLVSSAPYYAYEYTATKLSYAIGAAVAAAALAGFLLNRKNPAAKCGALAAAIGGVFSLYFVASLSPAGIIPYLMGISWAFIALIYKLAEKVLKPGTWLFKVFMIAAVAAVALYNYNGIRNIVVFSFNFYTG